MIKLALKFPEYEKAASKVNLIDVSSSEYYGEGYQDKKKVPFIKNTQTDLNWSPKVPFDESLLKIFL